MYRKSRLQRLYDFLDSQKNKVKVLTVGREYSIKNIEQLEEELKKPEYKNMTIIVDTIALEFEKLNKK